MTLISVSEKCPACDSTVTPRELCRVSFAGIAECPRCGLVRTWPSRTPKELAELHADPRYFRHPYFEARRDLGRDALRAKHVELLELLVGEAPVGTSVCSTLVATRAACWP